MLLLMLNHFYVSIIIVLLSTNLHPYFLNNEFGGLFHTRITITNPNRHNVLTKFVRLMNDYYLKLSSYY